VTKVGVVVAGSSDLTKTSIARDLSVGFFFLLVFAVFLFHIKNQTKNLNVQLSKRFSP